MLPGGKQLPLLNYEMSLDIFPKFRGLTFDIVINISKASRHIFTDIGKC